MTILTFAGRARAQLRRRRGQSWDCWPLATRAANAWPAAWPPSADAKERWVLGRGFLYGNRFPARVLSDVPPVPPIFPADRLDHLFEGHGGEEQQLALSSQQSARTEC